MMPYVDARAVARMFAALGEPTRLKIATHLLAGPSHVGALAEVVGEPMVNVSHHLGVMRQAGVLEDEEGATGFLPFPGRRIRGRRGGWHGRDAHFRTLPSLRPRQCRSARSEKQEEVGEVESSNPPLQHP
jgi:DNA-binding transcriptional ArsR family regulator